MEEKDNDDDDDYMISNYTINNNLAPPRYSMLCNP
jgi:hypothetical protein